MIIEKAVDAYNKVDNINTYYGVCKEGYYDVEAVQDLCGEPIPLWKKAQLFIWFILPGIAYIFLFENLSELIEPLLKTGFEEIHLPDCCYPLYALILGIIVVTGPAKDLICIIFDRW